MRLPLWRKSSQFFSLTRDHVAAVLNDTAVYRWQVGMWDVHQDGNRWAAWHGDGQVNRPHSVWPQTVQGV